jgi:hypothetical protein
MRLDGLIISLVGLVLRSHWVLQVSLQRILKSLQKDLLISLFNNEMMVYITQLTLNILC